MGAEAAFHEHQVKTQLRRCCLSYCKTYQQWEEKKKITVLQLKTRKGFLKKEKKKQGGKKALRGSWSISVNLELLPGFPLASSPEGTPEGRRTRLLASVILQQRACERG